MENRNIVFIAKSLDGFISGPNGELDFLNCVPNPDQEDVGFMDLMERIDALVMGRNTFTTVCNFGGEWPYPKPVFVLSNTLQEIPEEFQDKAIIVNGELSELVADLNSEGFHKLYIDGGSTIQSFLKEDLIDEMIISTMPILVGGGVPLFGTLPKYMMWDHVESKLLLGQITQDTYYRNRG
ncbi:dihydrofolate reductase family protein [Flammeovirga yaeyamensis]|uniref:Dihydrofolate reductase family protein n=1 Tax=Flammeovirga yaeyamensis TaxID=367791 RepID=A0AAX1N7I1_9BACT|nr:dihydrofolate reductase family protein [Flammeovirga yaeyamensis]MBB3699665.1 dihydrofolate reductase [Flammeovirga yaeyamensis]NMF36764.1 dihydrofolate reductase [Flammeovirga yaeyamensis]QWG02195.1 dihydrofolate reductase family protein [Flammeovirga yaeyamensis]